VRTDPTPADLAWESMVVLRLERVAVPAHSQQESTPRQTRIRRAAGSRNPGRPAPLSLAADPGPLPSLSPPTASHTATQIRDEALEGRGSPGLELNQALQYRSPKRRPVTHHDLIPGPENMLRRPNTSSWTPVARKPMIQRGLVGVGSPIPIRMVVPQMRTLSLVASCQYAVTSGDKRNMP